MGIRSAGPGTRGAAAVANSSAAFELGSHNANADADAAADAVAVAVAVASRQAPPVPRLHRSEPGLVLVSFCSVISAQKTSGLSCAHCTHALHLETAKVLSLSSNSFGRCLPLRYLPCPYTFFICRSLFRYYFNCKSLDNC